MKNHDGILDTTVIVLEKGLTKIDNFTILDPLHIALNIILTMLFQMEYQIYLYEQPV